MGRDSTLLEGTLWLFAFGLAAFLAFGFASCHDKGTNPNSGSSETSYFPLEVGNRWVYKENYKTGWVEDDSTWAMEVTRTEETEGEEYFVVSLLNFLGRPETRYYRTVKTDSVDALYYGKQLLYDFSSSVGTSWRFERKYDSRWAGPSGYTVVTLESRSDTVEVPAGRFVNCLRFRFDLGPGLGRYHEWLAPNVGIVKMIWIVGRPRVPFPMSELVTFTRGQ